MRLVVSFGAATLLALGGGAAWAAPATSSTVGIEVPVSGTVLNPCNGESVSWQGTAHFVVHQTVTSNGHDTLSGHVNFQGIQGQDSLGNAYRVANTANFELTTSGESAQSEFTTTAAFLFVSQGAAPNFDSHTTYHVSFDANGEPTATVIRIESSCQG
ncbi:MAG: hypothetical protein E6H90_13985 [Chloroflexi bacterium]|nr:MAG: hypothetical protein E6H90_13985 [Chloroflexota bacterium]